MKIYGKDTLNFSLLISSLSTFPSSYITLSHSPYIITYNLGMVIIVILQI